MPESKEKKIIHVHLGSQKYKTVLHAGDNRIVADEPEKAGGQNLGPDPYDLLLMSLGTCTAVTLRMYAERKEWPVKDIYLELRHYRDHVEDCVDCDDPASKIDIIEKEIIVEGDLSDEQVDRLLEISNKCPVYRTLTGDIEIKSMIEKR